MTAISCASAGRESPAASSAPVAARYWRRLSSGFRMVMTFPPLVRVRLFSATFLGRRGLRAELGQQLLLVIEKFHAQRIARARQPDCDLALYGSGMRRHHDHA